MILGNLSKTAEDGDGNVGKTIRLITEDKKRTWICKIKLTFVPSCSQMRLQLLHFHIVFKTWPTFQELTSIVSFRRRWSQWNFSERETYTVTKVNMCEDYGRNIFLASDIGVAVLVYVDCAGGYRLYININEWTWQVAALLVIFDMKGRLLMGWKTRSRFSFFSLGRHGPLSSHWGNILLVGRSLLCYL